MQINACIVQDSPIFMDKIATLQKVYSIVEDASNQDCDLIIFPESFVPGYPRGFDFGMRIGSRTEEGRKLYKVFYENSIQLDNGELKNLEDLAKQFNTYIVIGISEKERGHGSLYCSMVYISPYNGIMGCHRKIKPTGLERTIWAESDGSSLLTFDTHIGKLGGLICWENYMPLSRMSMYNKGVEIYIAPTADSRGSWTTTMKHIATEGRCFVLSSNQYVTKSCIPEEFQKFIKSEPHEMCRGGSIAVDPFGNIISGPLFSEKGFLRVNLEMDMIIKSKLDFDPNGHYTRKDIFTYTVKNQPDSISDLE